VHLETRVSGEPRLHLHGLVCAVVVADQVQVEVLGSGAVDLLQETDKFLGAMSRPPPAGDFTINSEPASLIELFGR
jgi:hypothetical protein